MIRCADENLAVLSQIAQHIRPGAADSICKAHAVMQRHLHPMRTRQRILKHVNEFAKASKRKCFASVTLTEHLGEWVNDTPDELLNKLKHPQPYLAYEIATVIQRLREECTYYTHDVEPLAEARYMLRLSTPEQWPGLHEFYLSVDQWAVANGYTTGGYGLFRKMRNNILGELLPLNPFDPAPKQPKPQVIRERVVEKIQAQPVPVKPPAALPCISGGQLCLSVVIDASLTPHHALRSLVQAGHQPEQLYIIEDAPLGLMGCWVKAKRMSVPFRECAERDNRVFRIDGKVEYVYKVAVGMPVYHDEGQL